MSTSTCPRRGALGGTTPLETCPNRSRRPITDHPSGRCFTVNLTKQRASFEQVAVVLRAGFGRNTLREYHSCAPVRGRVGALGLPRGCRAHCARARVQHWFDASDDIALAPPVHEHCSLKPTDTSAGSAEITSSARVCITRARAQCARQPRGSPESPCASSKGRARVILAQRVAPEPCAQLQETCANAAHRFGQIDGETSARRMIGDGSSHAPTARSERGTPSERTSSRTRRRAHGLLTRTMPPGSGGSPYLIILELHGRGPI